MTSVKTFVINLGGDDADKAKFTDKLSEIADLIADDWSLISDVAIGNVAVYILKKIGRDWTPPGLVQPNDKGRGAS